MIHYFEDGAGGFIGIDTSQRVREVPKFLFGKCAARPGNITTIHEQIWDPTTLSDEVNVSEVPEDWIFALGFEKPLTKTKKQPNKFDEQNPLPDKSFLVPLVPLEEYEEFMKLGIEDSVDICFPWETTPIKIFLTLLICIVLIVLLV